MSHSIVKVTKLLQRNKSVSNEELNHLQYYAMLSLQVKTEQSASCFINKRTNPRIHKRVINTIPHDLPCIYSINKTAASKQQQRAIKLTHFFK